MKLLGIFVDEKPSCCNDCIFVQFDPGEIEDSWTLCCSLLFDEFGNVKDVDECYDKGQRHSSCPLEIAR